MALARSASSATGATPFVNSEQIGSMTRTYLAMAVRLKIERHGTLAKEIAKLDADAATLEGLGLRMDAFQLKERGLSLRQRLYGQSHPVVTEFAKELCLQYSVVAMDLVRSGDKVSSLKLLEKAQLVSSSAVLFPDSVTRKQLLAVMYNNFGCYYKFLNKFQIALKFLQKALHIESSVPGCHNPAGTHLNVCALLSQMGRHKTALHHAQLAIHILTLERQAQKTQQLLGTASSGVIGSGVIASPSAATVNTAPPNRPQQPAVQSTSSMSMVSDSMSVASTHDFAACCESPSKETLVSVPGGGGGRASSPAGPPPGVQHTSPPSASPSRAGSGLAPERDSPTTHDAGSTPPAPGSLQQQPSFSRFTNPPSAAQQRNDESKSCLFVIALYNAAVEMEHIGCIQDAVNQYDYAAEIAVAELGDHHLLTHSVLQAADIARGILLSQGSKHRLGDEFKGMMSMSSVHDSDASSAGMASSHIFRDPALTLGEFDSSLGELLKSSFGGTDSGGDLLAPRAPTGKSLPGGSPRYQRSMASLKHKPSFASFATTMTRVSETTEVTDISSTMGDGAAAAAPDVTLPKDASWSMTAGLTATVRRRSGGPNNGSSPLAPGGGGGGGGSGAGMPPLSPRRRRPRRANGGSVPAAMMSRTSPIGDTPYTRNRRSLY